MCISLRDIEATVHVQSGKQYSASSDENPHQMLHWKAKTISRALKAHEACIWLSQYRPREGETNTDELQDQKGAGLYCKYINCSSWACPWHDSQTCKKQQQGGVWCVTLQQWPEETKLSLVQSHQRLTIKATQSIIKSGSNSYLPVICPNKPCSPPSLLLLHPRQILMMNLLHLSGKTQPTHSKWCGSSHSWWFGCWTCWYLVFWSH